MRSSAMPLVVRRKEDSLRRYCYIGHRQLQPQDGSAWAR